MEGIIKASFSLKKSIIDMFNTLPNLDHSISYQMVNIDSFYIQRTTKVDEYRVNKIRVSYGKHGWEISEFLLGNFEPKRIKDGQLLKDVRVSIY